MSQADPVADPVADARAARLTLESLLAGHDLRLPDAFMGRIETFVALLLGANQRLNLTRVVEPDAVARLHLLDALAAAPLLDRIAPARALDIGSGGGIPGLVLALARPEVQWTLVDSVGKKADAMRGFVAALDLETILVLAERAEVLGRDASHRGRYDLVTARACAALPVLAEYALPLLRVGGTLLAWKGAISEDELRAGSAASTALGGGTPEILSTGFDELGDHRFVVIEKLAPTPDGYPRRPGLASRRPLG